MIVKEIEYMSWVFKCIPPVFTSYSNWCCGSKTYDENLLSIILAPVFFVYFPYERKPFSLPNYTAFLGAIAFIPILLFNISSKAEVRPLGSTNSSSAREAVSPATYDDLILPTVTAPLQIPENVTQDLCDPFLA